MATGFKGESSQALVATTTIPVTEEFPSVIPAHLPELPTWPFSTRAVAIRLFVTCWLVYSLHFATNIVREIYPALSIGDHLSFRVDEYARMHPDLFEKEGYGWHIGANPGASMLAAIPYALARPVIDRVVTRVQEKRAASGQTEPPAYNSPWPLTREFYKEAWRRGLDVKFGLAAFVMQSMCMAPICGLGVVVMFYVLRRIFGSDKYALWLALLYAFGTAVFFRAGYLNHNMMLGHLAFMGFVALWNPGDNDRWSIQRRFFLGGLCGGTTLLMDYSGVVFLAGLFVYAVVKRLSVTRTAGHAIRNAGWYLLGAIGPIGLLWFYQWQSFGHPLYPGQHWMPPVEWIDRGYQGFGPPQFDLFVKLGFDYRYGLFVSTPLLLLALVAPFVNRRERQIPKLELATLLLLFACLWAFLSGINYTRLQFNTGIRYFAPIVPFLFIPAAVVLMRLRRRVIYFVAVLSVTEAWCMAMYRDVERGLGVLDPILHVFIGGLKLPALSVLGGMSGQYGEYSQRGVSPIPLFILTAAILYGIWSCNRRPQRLKDIPSGAI